MVESIKSVVDQPYITLNNGNRIPQIGLGTANDDPTKLEEVVKVAFLEHGYRHLDTAAYYRNEEYIGNGLQ